MTLCTDPRIALWNKISLKYRWKIFSLFSLVIIDDPERTRFDKAEHLPRTYVGQRLRRGLRRFEWATKLRRDCWKYREMMGRRKGRERERGVETNG